MRWPNDWNLRDCLLLCSGITIAEVILAVLAQIGIEIPVLQQVSGFIFVTLIPGILLLRVMKVHGINVVESIAYSIGLSLALVMFSGAAINFILPLIQIVRPLTAYPVMITLAAETAILIIAAWSRDREYVPTPKTSIKWPPSLNTSLSLLSILLLIILGVKISDATGSNLVLIACLLLIAIVIGLAAFKKLITPDVYPLAIFVIGLGLLYQTTLMSPYPVGSDIYSEYQYYQYAAANGVWNFTLPNPVNSCLSIVVLGPTYSLMMGIDAVWVLKAVYPLVFAILPIILFRIFKFQIGAVPSFFAVFFFMAVPTFSLEMISLCRQQVAEIFLALTLLLIVERRLTQIQKLVMLIIFSLSIAVSHYSMGFITMAFMLLLIPLFAIIRSKSFLRVWAWLTSRTGGIPQSIRATLGNSIPLKLLIIPVAVYFVFLLAWYSLIASGVNLYFISSVLNFQVAAVSQEVTSGLDHAAAAPLIQIGNRPDLIRTALGLDFFEVTWQGKLFRLFQYITQIFIVTGCFRLLIRPRGLSFKGIFIALSVTSAGLLAACILVPGFAGILNATRWYHISLLTLAPFFIIGAETAWEILSSARGKLRHKTEGNNTGNSSNRYLIYVTMLILIPYFILTSGLVFELTGYHDISRAEAPYSIALSSYRLDLTGTITDRDGKGAEWLGSTSGAAAATVYCDSNSGKIFILFPSRLKLAIIPRQGSMTGSSYVYLTNWNVVKGQLTFSESGKPGLRQYINIEDVPEIRHLVSEGMKIYTNGGSAIYITN